MRHDDRRSLVLDLARWVAIGTVAAVGLGAAIGLTLGILVAPFECMIGGATTGLVGGPAFGAACGLLDRRARPRRTGLGHRVGSFATAGAIVYTLAPFVVGLVRGQTIGPEDDPSEIAFGVLVLAAAGAGLGAMVASYGGEAEGRGLKHENGWTELEL